MENKGLVQTHIMTEKPCTNIKRDTRSHTQCVYKFMLTCCIAGLLENMFLSISGSFSTLCIMGLFIIWLIACCICSGFPKFMPPRPCNDKSWPTLPKFNSPLLHRLLMPRMLAKFPHALAKKQQPAVYSAVMQKSSSQGQKVLENKPYQPPQA